MPTDAKRAEVASLAERVSRATIIIATDFTGLNVNQLTELRRQLREAGIEYRVVKNRLAALAATESGVEPFRELLEGSSGIVFGYGDAAAAARTLDEYIKQSRSSMQVRLGVMDGELLTAAQVSVLAALPPLEQLRARVLGQLSAPMVGLVTVLTGVMRGLVTVLERRTEQLAEG